MTASTNAGADTLPAPGQQKAERPNAFAAMMQQQRELSRMAVFYLMQSEQGQFSIHWWLKAGGASKKHPEQQRGPAHQTQAPAQPPGQQLGTDCGAGQAPQAGPTRGAAKLAPDTAGAEGEARQAPQAARAPTQVPAAGPGVQPRQGMQAACEAAAVWTSATQMSASTVHGQQQPGGSIAKAAAKLPVVLMTNVPSGLGGEVRRALSLSFWTCIVAPACVESAGNLIGDGCLCVTDAGTLGVTSGKCGGCWLAARAFASVSRDKCCPCGMRCSKLRKHATCHALAWLILAAVRRPKVQLQVSWESQGLRSSQGPSERRFRGSCGILKSALQKNVRLGRTDASVR